MSARPTNPRAQQGVHRHATRALVAVSLVAVSLAGLGASLGGCYATEPVLYPSDPPANVPEGLLILQVPADAVTSMRSVHVAEELGSMLLGDALNVGYEPISDERRQQILAHQVVTGMTLREVKWAFVADPARVRQQGPPGGTTLIWESPGRIHGSFWVRFDHDGEAVDAGSY